MTTTHSGLLKDSYPRSTGMRMPGMMKPVGMPMKPAGAKPGAKTGGKRKGKGGGKKGC